ncbi:MAG: hypothetical protein AAGI23_08435 [Bacteroidota bacterium]
MQATPQLNHFNKHQLEILKLFARELEDSDLIKIKRLITTYLAQKLTKMADEIWDQNNWTNEDMERLLKTHRRTPYDPEN